MTVTKNTTWSDPGFACTTSTGVSCEHAVQVSGSVNTSQAGTYTLIYQYTDQNSGLMQTVRTVYVIDGTNPNPPSGSPSLTLIGEDRILVTPNNVYYDPGFACTTSTGANCFDAVTISGSVNMNPENKDYRLEYRYTDPNGMTVSRTRTVHV